MVLGVRGLGVWEAHCGGPARWDVGAPLIPSWESADCEERGPLKTRRGGDEQEQSVEDRKQTVR